MWKVIALLLSLAGTVGIWFLMENVWMTVFAGLVFLWAFWMLTGGLSLKQNRGTDRSSYEAPYEAP